MSFIASMYARCTCLIPRPGDQNSSQADPAFLRFEPTGLPSSRQVPINEIWYYIFGAICPAHGKGAGLVLPRCTTEGMTLHLNEIAQAVAPGAHALVLVDQA